MIEMTMYKVRIPDPGCPSRALTFYARKRGKFYEAICLGFAPHDKNRCDEDAYEYNMRQEREMAARSMRLRSTLIKGDNGKVFDQRWSNQAVLVALWRKLEKLEFLRLPKNPFLRSKPPKHEDIVDFDKRFYIFHTWERDLPVKLRQVEMQYGRNKTQD